MFGFMSVMHLQPPTQNMPMGPGGMNQSGPPPQPPHGHNMPSEGMVSGGPPAPHMQNQMNGQMPGKYPPPPLKKPSLCPSFLSPSFPSVPVSLGLPSNSRELWGRSFCWMMMSPNCQLWSWAYTPFDYGYPRLLWCVYVSADCCTTHCVDCKV